MASRPSSAPASPAAGFTVIELVVAAVVALALALFSIAPLMATASAVRLDVACQEVVGVLRLARSEAIKRNTSVGLKFHIGRDGGVTFTLHRDGDGDGILTRDIAAGVDPALGPARALTYLGRDVRFGFPPGPPPRDPGDPSHRLDRLGDPIRFNNSDIASFSPLGTSTPGTLYVTDGRDRLIAIRVLGRSGRVRQLLWERQHDRWRE